MRTICGIFADLGFQVYRSREVEDDLTNFELLNMPAASLRPATCGTRFHTTVPGVLLAYAHVARPDSYHARAATHGPFRVILPGMCYRYESRHDTKRNDVPAKWEGLGRGRNTSPWRT